MTGSLDGRKHDCISVYEAGNKISEDASDAVSKSYWNWTSSTDSPFARGTEKNDTVVPWKDDSTVVQILVNVCSGNCKQIGLEARWTNYIVTSVLTAKLVIICSTVIRNTKAKFMALINILSSSLPTAFPFGRICFVVLIMRKGRESSSSGPWHLGCIMEVFHGPGPVHTARWAECVFLCLA